MRPCPASGCTFTPFNSSHQREQDSPGMIYGHQGGGRRREDIAPAVLSTSVRMLPKLSVVPSKPTGFDRGELIRTHYKMQVGRFISLCQEVLNGVIVRSEISEVPMWNHA